MNLKLDLNKKTEESSDIKSQHEESNLGDIKVKMVWDDGQTTEEKNFSMGETVKNIKKWIKDNKDVPYESISVLYEDKPMMDPLSLNDIIPDIKDREELELKIKLNGYEKPKKNSGEGGEGEGGEKKESKGKGCNIF